MFGINNNSGNDEVFYGGLSDCLLLFYWVEIVEVDDCYMGYDLVEGIVCYGGKQDGFDEEYCYWYLYRLVFVLDDCWVKDGVG